MILFPWQKQHPALRRFSQSIRSIRSDSPVERTAAAVLDLEFDSLNLREARILSIAIVPINQGWIDLDGLWSCYVQHTQQQTEAIPIHGILQAQLSAGLPEPEALEQCLLRLEGRLLVGHGLELDLQLLRKRFKALQWGPFRPKSQDTLLLARRLDGPHQPPNASYQLSQLCKKHQLPHYAEHTAAGDALATALLWLKLRELAP
ncbi:MAG: 3'-5' exonuclease [Sphingobacteriaceae bacterium]|nr:3'-5' exonuclease [Sphingobacteriaceae bacterium]